MTQAWVVLTGSDGRDIAAPSASQLAAALAEVYPGADQQQQHERDSDSDSHSDSDSDCDPDPVVLRFGYDDGLMYELEVSRGGNVKFEEWSDSDREIALDSPKTMSALTLDQALQLWTWLAQRQVAKIRSQPWISTD
jgi:hypothetical protein